MASNVPVSSQNARPASIVSQSSSTTASTASHVSSSPQHVLGTGSSGSNRTSRRSSIASASVTPSVRPSPPQTGVKHVTTVQSTAIPDKPRVWDRIKRWKYFVLALTIYALTLGITLTVSYRYTLLGAVSVPVGIFILNLLAKSGDIAYALAVSEAIDNFVIGKMASGEPLPMERVLALNSATGLHGAFSTSCSTLRGLGSTRYWAGLRVMAILAAPGPGLLLMASVDPQDYYFTTQVAKSNNSDLLNPHTVSAGIGSFQPEMAELYQDAARIQVPYLTQTLLQDRAYANQVNPISAECRINAKCVSLALSTGIQAIKPWPYLANAQANADRSRIVVEHMVSYHLETWPVAETWDIENDPCSVYGYGSDSRFIVCARTVPEIPGSLAAGWRMCAPLQSSNTTTARCDIAEPSTVYISSTGWTSLRFNIQNRTFTQLFSLLDSSANQIQDAGAARPVTIEPRDILTSLDVLLWPSAREASIVEDSASLQASVTSFLSATLSFGFPSLGPRANKLNTSQQLLANMIFTPLFLFNPLMYSTTELGEDSSKPQPGLGDLFYVRASYAYVSRRPVPRYETLIAYAALGGVILLSLFVVQCLAIRYRTVETPVFPLLDFSNNLKVIHWKVSDSTAAQNALEVDLARSFGGKESTDEVLVEALKHSVIARD